MKTNCKGCYYFKPYCFKSRWQDEYGIDNCPAACEHSDCYKIIPMQDRYGSIQKARKRTKNIIDFVLNGECERFIGFHYEKRKPWWIFKEKVKVKNERKQKVA